MGHVLFGHVLKNERKVRGASLNALGAELQKWTGKKGLAANLSRLEHGRERPTEKRVQQIGHALSSFANESGVEQDRLLSKLMSAAGLGSVTEESELDYLRRKARSRLESSPDLRPDEIESILRYLSTPTLKQIAETPKDERIAVIDLRAIATELTQKAQDLITSDNKDADNRRKEAGVRSFDAGRAVIQVRGPLTDRQARLLSDVARMIGNALD